MYFSEATMNAAHQIKILLYMYHPLLSRMHNDIQKMNFAMLRTYPDCAWSASTEKIYISRLLLGDTQIEYKISDL